MKEIQLKKMITFKQNEKDLFDHLNTKRNISVYVKDLIEEDMKRTGTKVENEVVKVKEEIKKETQAYDDF